MRKATSVILPPDIIEFILHTFISKEKNSRRSGRSGYTYDLTKDLNEFIEGSDDRLVSLKAQFCHGITECMVKRAFNLKTPYGATKDLRDVLALYTSDGEHNWNRLIETRFPCHISLLDKAEEPNGQLVHKPTLKEIFEMEQKIIQQENKIIELENKIIQLLTKGSYDI